MAKNEEDIVLMQTILAHNNGDRTQTLIDFSTIQDLLELQNLKTIINSTRKKRDKPFRQLLSQRLDLALEQEKQFK